MKRIISVKSVGWIGDWKLENDLKIEVVCIVD